MRLRMAGAPTQGTRLAGDGSQRKKGRSLRCMCLVLAVMCGGVLVYTGMRLSAATAAAGGPLNGLPPNVRSSGVRAATGPSDNNNNNNNNNNQQPDPATATANTRGGLGRTAAQPPDGTYLPPTPAVGDVLTMLVSLIPADPGTLTYHAQLNSLKALYYLPGVTPVVFTKDDVVVDAVNSLDLGIQVVSDFTVNRHGSPHLASLFHWAEGDSPATRRVQSTYVGYSNADILFGSDLLVSLGGVTASVSRNDIQRPFIVGKRYNLQLSEDSFSPDASPFYVGDSAASVDTVNARARVETTPFNDGAQDFFIMEPGIIDWSQVPELVIGRRGYDNYLVASAYRWGFDTIDVSSTVHAVHQTGSAGNMAGHVMRPDKDWNMKKIGLEPMGNGLLSKCLFQTDLIDGSIHLSSRKKDPALKQLWKRRTSMKRYFPTKTNDDI